MPRLDCSVATCKYNQDHGCVRDKISVGGMSASNPHETCCDSFEERRTSSMTNSFSEPSVCVDIRCEAKNCLHNDGCRCQAERIDMGGSNASECRQTDCGTFCMK